MVDLVTDINGDICAEPKCSGHAWLRTESSHPGRTSRITRWCGASFSGLVRRPSLKRRGRRDADHGLTRAD
jgi:hypothetical protein